MRAHVGEREDHLACPVARLHQGHVLVVDEGIRGPARLRVGGHRAGRDGEFRGLARGVGGDDGVGDAIDEEVEVVLVHARARGGRRFGVFGQFARVGAPQADRVGGRLVVRARDEHVSDRRVEFLNFGADAFGRDVEEADRVDRDDRDAFVGAREHDRLRLRPVAGFDRRRPVVLAAAPGDVRGLVATRVVRVAVGVAGRVAPQPVGIDVGLLELERARSRPQLCDLRGGRAARWHERGVRFGRVGGRSDIRLRGACLERACRRGATDRSHKRTRARQQRTRSLPTHPLIPPRLPTGTYYSALVEGNRRRPRGRPGASQVRLPPPISLSPTSTSRRTLGSSSLRPSVRERGPAACPRR